MPPSDTSRAPLTWPVTADDLDGVVVIDLAHPAPGDVPAPERTGDRGAAPRTVGVSVVPLGVGLLMALACGLVTLSYLQ